MCGICGFTGKEDKVLVESMANAIVHRGPDEAGFYSDGKINLGMRRLSIIDVESGKQPIHNEDRSVWTVFNGEIYNYRELRKELEDRGHRFYTSHSDTEVIVHLFEEYGIDFVNKINGMFAIAVWDKNSETLYLIRDRMGVKPLFYSINAKELTFGSEIKCILRAINRYEMNYEAIYHYFTLKNIPAPMTAFNNIWSLLPGEMLIFKNGEASFKKWWKIHFKEDEKYDEHYVKEKILILLENATKIRMRSDVPFGAYLSGGVDSSAIVALMNRYSEKPIVTFSLGYEDELKNKEADLYYARKVSKMYGTEHYEYIMSASELVEDLPSVVNAFDQPFSGTISTFFLSKLIKKHVKVALSGDGADELFGSYLSHRVARPIFNFARLYDKYSSNSLTDEEMNTFAPCDLEFLSRLYEKSKGNETLWRYNLYQFNDQEKNFIISKEFKHHLVEANSFSLIENYFASVTASDPLNRILEMEWNTQLPDQVLAFVDFLSMAHSVEVRSPFLDYRLVEFAATIPGRLKIKDGIVKYVLKEAVEELLPPGITSRPKEGFVLPVFDWMVDKLKDYSMDTLSEERLNKHGLLQPEAVRMILNGYLQGDKSYAGRVWNLIMFQEWWENFFG